MVVEPAHQIVRQTPPASVLQREDGGEPCQPALEHDLRSERLALAAVRTCQAPITDHALLAGLEALGRALVRRHPGRRFLFEAAPRGDCAGLVDGGQVARRLAAPENPNAALVDRIAVKSREVV